MTDEPDQSGEGRPKPFNKLTGWIGGLTAVVLALAGLKAAAGQLDLFGSNKPVEGEQAASNEPVAGDTAPATASAADALPTSYTGTWEGKDVTLEYSNGIWIETTGEGDDQIITNYEQLSRTPAMTNAIDRNRNLYVRWPSEGGTLEESEDALTWTRSYKVTAG